MPCDCSGYPEESRDYEARQAIKAACELALFVSDHSLLSKETRDWLKRHAVAVTRDWLNRHDVADARRQALAKLTVEDKRLLGLL